MYYVGFKFYSEVFFFSVIFTKKKMNYHCTL